MSEVHVFEKHTALDSAQDAIPERADWEDVCDWPEWAWDDECHEWEEAHDGTPQVSPMPAASRPSREEGGAPLRASLAALPRLLGDAAAPPAP